MAKQDDFVRVTVRIPPDLHEKLLEAGRTSSMNAEIIRRLDESFTNERAKRRIDLTHKANTDPDVSQTIKDAVSEILNETDQRLVDLLSRYETSLHIKHPWGPPPTKTKKK